MWSEITEAINRQIPPFNNYLLKEYRAEQVSQCLDYIHTVFQEAIKLFGDEIQYHGYKVLSPEKRLDYLIENQLTKGRYNVQKSELQLIEFTFEYDKQLFHSHIYLPYLHHGCVVVNDTKYYIQLAIIERIIYRALDCVVVKVMRSPIHFWRTEQYAYSSMEGKSFYDAILTVKVHYKNRKHTKKDIKTALLLYMLSTYSFNGTLDIFGISHTDVYLLNTYKEKPGYLTFKCRDDVYIQVKEEIMHNVTARRVIASMIYLFSFFDFYTFNDLYCVDGSTFRIMLGKAIFGPAYKTALACSQADTHLSSLSTYLDPITRTDLAKQGLVCKDIYDLFYQIFTKLDTLLINHAPNDLYEKKIGVLELLMSDLVKSIFHKFYETMKKQKSLNTKVVRGLFRLSSQRISNIYKSTLVRGFTAYNDNELLSLMGKKVRQPANQDSVGKKSVNLLSAREHRFHPSFVSVESMLAIPSSSPGVSGSINPYTLITRDTGCFVKGDWTKDIDELEVDLPSR